MTPRKLKLLICTFSYGGNGGFKSQHPAVGDFKARVIMAAKKDPRISEVADRDLSDTPITMNRNRAVLLARQIKADVLLMVDSDQEPDFYLGRDKEAKPFWESSFDFLYQNYERFPKGCVIGSPYCGMPLEEENVFVFRMTDFIGNTPDPNFALVPYSRAEASVLTGITPVAALPTGVTLWDTRVFELTEPSDFNPDSDMATEKERWRGWFYYEWKDKYASEKGSTEDVTATRDIYFAGLVQHDYNPVFCNWDGWAGHYKPKMVGKPEPLPQDYVSNALKRAVLEGKRVNERMICLKPEDTAMNIGERAKSNAEANGNGHAPILQSNIAQRYVDAFCGVKPGMRGKPLSEAEATRWNNVVEGPEYGQVLSGHAAEKPQTLEEMNRDTALYQEYKDEHPDASSAQLAKFILKNNLRACFSHDNCRRIIADAAIADDEKKNDIEASKRRSADKDKPASLPELFQPGGFYTAEADLNALTKLVQRLAERFPDRPLEILEVGSFCGGSALALERGFGPQGGTLYCVDTWEGSDSDVTGDLAKECDLFRVFCENVNLGKERLHKTIKPIVGKSVEVAAGMYRTFDLVFIDADHEYESVKADIEAWLPKVRSGGILCGHDYGLVGFPGVKKAVDEMMGQAVRKVGQCVWSSMVSGHTYNMLQPEAVG